MSYFSISFNVIIRANTSFLLKCKQERTQCHYFSKGVIFIYNFLNAFPYYQCFVHRYCSLFLTALKECGDGTYGYNCINNCSGHCLGDYHCNKETGRCDVGCKPGYTTDNCSKSNCIIIYTFLFNSFTVITPR